MQQAVTGSWDLSWVDSAVALAVVKLVVTFDDERSYFANPRSSVKQELAPPQPPGVRSIYSGRSKRKQPDSGLDMQRLSQYHRNVVIIGIIRLSSIMGEAVDQCDRGAPVAPTSVPVSRYILHGESCPRVACCRKCLIAV